MKRMNREVGRPKKITSKKELIKKINEYFTNIEEEKITITGLCLTLGIHKDTFYEYAKNEDYKDIINEARTMVENSYELTLRKYGRTGDIFALKNFGWKDKTEIETNQNIKVDNPYKELSTEELKKLAGD